MKSIILTASITLSVALFTAQAFADNDDYQQPEGIGAFSCGIGHAQALEHVGEQFVCHKTYESQEALDNICKEAYGAKVHAISIIGDCLK